MVKAHTQSPIWMKGTWMPYDDGPANSTTKGRIGEYFVAYLLEREGVECTIVDRRGTDIFCRRSDDSLFTLEVKTASKPIYPSNASKTPRANYDIKRTKADWYAFVDLSTQLVLFKPRSEVEKYANRKYYLDAGDFSPYEMQKTLQQVKG